MGARTASISGRAPRQATPSRRASPARRATDGGQHRQRAGATKQAGAVKPAAILLSASQVAASAPKVNRGRGPNARGATSRPD